MFQEIISILQHQKQQMDLSQKSEIPQKMLEDDDDALELGTYPAYQKDPTDLSSASSRL